LSNTSATADLFDKTYKSAFDTSVLLNESILGQALSPNYCLLQHVVKSVPTTPSTMTTTSHTNSKPMGMYRIDIFVIDT
jgi:hypothetical protein